MFIIRFIYNIVVMSTVRSDLANSHLRNYSFNLNEDISFANVNLTHNKKYTVQPSPSRTQKYTRQYEMNRQNIVPNQPLLPPPLSTLTPSHLQNLDDLQFLQQEVRRLEDVIFYVGTTNDKLIIECDQKQKQIAFLKICNQKYKQQTEAQIRKLKEIINDKTSECEVVAKNAKREKEALEQETDRLRFNLKAVIEKKNDELFNMSREKDRQIHNSKKELQNAIEQIEATHRKENDQNKSIIGRLNDEIQYLKEKYEQISQEYNHLDEEFQKQKIKIYEENEANLSELKQKYYRNKLLLIQTSQEEVRILEESSQLQRDVFLLELQKMREQIDRVARENRQLNQRGAMNDTNHEQNVQQYEKMIQNLKTKLDNLCRSKQQQIEALKVKIGVLHSQNLKSVQTTYISRINILEDKVQSQNNQIRRLQDVLKNQLQKSHALGLKMRRKELQIEQELAKMKLTHSQAEEALRLKFQTQKSMIMQQSASVIKGYSARAGNMQFYEEELRKLRHQLSAKTQQCEEQEDVYLQRAKQWQQQREQLTKRIKILHQTLQENNHQTQRQLQSKNRQIAQLNDKLLKTIRESPLPDYSPFQKQIDNLKQELSQRKETENNLKQKSQQAQKKCREYQEQFEKIHLEGEMIINEAKGEWEAITQQKVDEIQQFYQQKCDCLQNEKEQLKKIKDELQNKTSLLVVQYKELQNTLAQVLHSLKKRSQLDQKVIQLGLDVNLVKNKQQLFQQ